MRTGEGEGGPEPLLHQNNSSSKAPRLPRWTRQEIMVLIEGKRVAETRGGRVLGGSGEAQAEPKWTTVSSYCKRHGVERGAVQCRKRWSNLAGDYKKIKDWESSLSERESLSFWGMRNDVRRDKRLPGFFDREVYGILEAHARTRSRSLSSSLPHHQEETAAADVGLVLALGRCSPASAAATMEEEEEEPDETVFFDSGRPEQGMFSDSEPPNIPAPLPISEQQFQPFTKGPSSDGTAFGKQKDGFKPEVGNTSREGHKRKRSSRPDWDDDKGPNTLLQHKLIEVLENNGKMLSDHLQSQNTNSQLDREQRKEHVDSLVAVLGKLADAFGRIADKL